MRFFKSTLLAVCLAVANVGCGGDDTKGGDDTGQPPAPGQQAGQMITAASGGEVAVGAAKLAVPPGALAADTEITVETLAPASSLPDRGSVRGVAYELGPDGTTFLAPAELTLPLPAAPSSGQEAVISWLDEATNTWQDLPTTASSGAVRAPVDHFTLFVVRFKDAAPIDCGFTACGGDLVGSWKIQGACLDFPTNEACLQAVVDVDLNYSGDITFGADGTYSAVIAGTGTATFNYPASCLQGVPDCASISSDETTCTGDPSTSGCTCTATLEENDTSSGTYTTSGNTLVMTDAEDGTPDTNEFCVQGNQLKVGVVNEDGGQIWTATKQ